MKRKVLALALCGMLAAAVVLTAKLSFLWPYREVILYRYGQTIAIAAAVLALNLFGLIFWVWQTVGLKQTGQHLELFKSQLGTKQTTNRELAERLHREDE